MHRNARTHRDNPHPSHRARDRQHQSPRAPPLHAPNAQPPASPSPALSSLRPRVHHNPAAPRLPCPSVSSACLTCLHVCRPEITSPRPRSVGSRWLSHRRRTRQRPHRYSRNHRDRRFILPHWCPNKAIECICNILFLLEKYVFSTGHRFERRQTSAGIVSAPLNREIYGGQISDHVDETHVCKEILGVIWYLENRRTRPSISTGPLHIFVGFGPDPLRENAYFQAIFQHRLQFIESIKL